MNEQVTISCQAIYESGNNFEYVFVDDSEESDFSEGYYDLRDKQTRDVVCMDGETCTIIERAERWITLRNDNGEESTEFYLTPYEFAIAAIAIPE